MVGQKDKKTAVCLVEGREHEKVAMWVNAMADKKGDV